MFSIYSVHFNIERMIIFEISTKKYRLFLTLVLQLMTMPIGELISYMRVNIIFFACCTKLTMIFLNFY